MAGPVANARNVRAPHCGRTFAADHFTTLEARWHAFASAIVAKDQDESIVAQLEFFQLGDDGADKLIGVRDHIRKMLVFRYTFAGFFFEIIGALRRRIIRIVREDHRIIQEERRVFFTGDKIERVIVDNVGTVFVLGIVDLLAIDFEPGIFVSSWTAVELPKRVFIKTKMRRTRKIARKLPFSCDACRVTSSLEEIAKCLLRRIKMTELGVVAAIANSCHQLCARRRTEWLRMALLEANTSRGELVHHGRFVTFSAVGGDTFVAEVVDENQHHVRLAFISVKRR